MKHGMVSMIKPGIFRRLWAFYPVIFLGCLFLGSTTACNESSNSKEDTLQSKQSSERRSIPRFSGNPNDFVPGISNPYLAFSPGKIFHYASLHDEGAETVRVEITHDTLTILGIAMTVVHDQVFLNNSLVEDTYDWFAQDTDGNVWYFGEDSKEIENGVVLSTEGSWKAGVNGAQPGILMLAEPQSGISYYQEYAIGVAEDQAKVLHLEQTVTIGLGTMEGCLETQEWSALSPGVREHKYYKPGTGLVLEMQPRSSKERVELTGVQ